MAAFTTIANGDDIQGAALLNELTVSINERAEASAIDASSVMVDAVAAGTDIQARAFWLEMQTAVERLALGGDGVNGSSFLDHEADFTDMSAFTWMTVARCREIAGLHADGFRRATSWPTDWTDDADAAYSHGAIAAGDIIGPWLIVDLQRMLSALQWTLAQSGFGETSCGTMGATDTGYLATTGGTIGGVDCAAAESAQATDWTDVVVPGGWAADGTYVYYAIGIVESGPAVGAVRYRGLVDVTISDVVPCAVDFYGYMMSAGDVFVDVDSLGLTEDTWHYFDTAAAPGAPDATMESPTYWGNTTANPYTTAGNACPTVQVRGVLASESAAVCKWVFSYA
jgi:hypothetical protein